MIKEPEKNSSTPNPANVSEIIRKGNEIYETLKEGFERDNSGKYIVIEVDSGKYFIGETRDEAVVTAKKSFPNIIMFVRRIGHIEKASRHLLNNSYNYARLF